MTTTRLSPAEQRVLAELATAPDTHEEIAERLGVTMHTVNVHITNMFYKTGCKNSTQLVLWGFREAYRVARPVVLVVKKSRKSRKKFRSA
jgi:DNA-binding CsgD family transcriptional regulator